MDDTSALAPSLDYALIGFNVRCLRMARDLTQAEFAKLCQIEKATVYRLERGLKVHHRTLEKVGTAIGESVAFINSVLPYGRPSEQRTLFIHRRADNTWFPGGDRRKKIADDDHARIQNPAERARLGRMGLVGSFQAYSVVMPCGPAMSQVEVFSESDFGQNPSYEDCVLVCARGEVIFRMREKEVHLCEGDTIGFDASEPVMVRPVQPLGGSDKPPTVWVITANRRGHIPVEFRRARRMRTRHKESRDVMKNS